MKLMCDNCDKEFKFSKIKLKEKNITNEISKIYYKCPLCKFEYIVSYKDKEVRENIKAINILYQEAVKGDKTALIKIQNLKERNIELSNRYKALFREV